MQKEIIQAISSVVLAILISAGSAKALDYYVDQNASNASDRRTLRKWFN